LNRPEDPACFLLSYGNKRETISLSKLMKILKNTHPKFGSKLIYAMQKNIKDVKYKVKIDIASIMNTEHQIVVEIKDSKVINSDKEKYKNYGKIILTILEKRIKQNIKFLSILLIIDSNGVTWLADFLECKLFNTTENIQAKISDQTLYSNRTVTDEISQNNFIKLSANRYNLYLNPSKRPQSSRTPSTEPSNKSTEYKNMGFSDCVIFGYRRKSNPKTSTFYKEKSTSISPSTSLKIMIPMPVSLENDSLNSENAELNTIRRPIFIKQINNNLNEDKKNNEISVQTNLENPADHDLKNSPQIVNRNFAKIYKSQQCKIHHKHSKSIHLSCIGLSLNSSISNSPKNLENPYESNKFPAPRSGLQISARIAHTFKPKNIEFILARPTTIPTGVKLRRTVARNRQYQKSVCIPNTGFHKDFTK